MSGLEEGYTGVLEKAIHYAKKSRRSKDPTVIWAAVCAEANVPCVGDVSFFKDLKRADGTDFSSISATFWYPLTEMVEHLDIWRYPTTTFYTAGKGKETAATTYTPPYTRVARGRHRHSYLPI